MSGESQGHPSKLIESESEPSNVPVKTTLYTWCEVGSFEEQESLQLLDKLVAEVTPYLKVIMHASLVLHMTSISGFKLREWGPFDS